MPFCKYNTLLLIMGEKQNNLFLCFCSLKLKTKGRTKEHSEDRARGKLLISIKFP